MTVEVAGHSQGRAGQVSVSPALNEVDIHALIFLRLYVILLGSESYQ